MALNFRLSYNTGYEYTDLLPYTKIEAIQNVGSILSYSNIDIAVPAFTGQEQNIAVALTEKQAKSPFDVYLLEEDNGSMYAYCSIDQIESYQDKIVITRLGRGSEVPITLRLIFKEAGL